MPTLPVALGGTIRQLRVAAGYSQRSFADICGVHRTLISAIERGKSNACLSTVERLASSLGLTPSELLRTAEKART